MMNLDEFVAKGASAGAVYTRSAQLTGNEDIPTWWADALGERGGPPLADRWDAATPLFPKFKQLLRSEYCLGVALAVPRHRAPRLQVAISDFSALRRGAPDEADPGVITCAQPLNYSARPKWWNKYPPELQVFYSELHAFVGDFGISGLLDPSHTQTQFASEIFEDPRVDPEGLSVFQECPDPEELFLVAELRRFLLFVDIGQRTFQGWEVTPAPDMEGGPHPAPLLDRIDDYLVRDLWFEDDLPDTYEVKPPFPPPLRPRNPEVHWQRLQNQTIV
jgi:hypothetical protein